MPKRTQPRQPLPFRPVPANPSASPSAAQPPEPPASPPSSTFSSALSSPSAPGLLSTQADLAEYIRNLTDNGAEIVGFFLQIMRDPGVHLRYRKEAAEWLANRAWGKEPQEVRVNPGGMFEGLLHATDRELTAILRGEIPADFDR